MAKMAIGSDDRGPFVRITGDQYDPRTEPDENYGNFRFNSRHTKHGYFDHFLTVPANLSPRDKDGREVKKERFRTDRTTTWTLSAGPVAFSSSSRSFYVYFGQQAWYRKGRRGQKETVYGSNGLAAYDYPTLCDVYLTDSSGWNYPNWMRSNRNRFLFFKLDNNWGSTVMWSAEAGVPEGDPARARYNQWRAQAVQGHLKGYQCNFIITPFPLSIEGIKKFSQVRKKRAGQRVIEIDNRGVRIARPGFDTRTATDKQLIIGGRGSGMPVYMARRTRISAHQTLRIALPSWVPGDAKVLMQWNIRGKASRLPPLWQRARRYNRAVEIRWKITAKTLIIENQAPFDYDLVFIVVSQHPPMDPLGGPAIRQGIEGGEKFIRIVQEDGRMAADSRWSYLPIIKAGFVRGQGKRTASVTFPDQGYIPFVWYACALVTTGDGETSEPWYIGPRVFFNAHNAFDYTSNTATITRNRVTFESHCNSKYDGTQRRGTIIRSRVAGVLGQAGPVGPVSVHHFAYYIFAIPDVQAA